MKSSAGTKTGIASVTLAAIALSTSGCQDPNALKGAVWGGMAGTAIGAIAGDDREAIAAGAAVGAAMGAVAGGVMKAKRYKNYGGQPGYPQQGYPQQGYPQQGYPQGAYQQQDYPVARYAGNQQVYSPYTGKLVDVSGFRSGELAIDPTTSGSQPFRVP